MLCFRQTRAPDGCGHSSTTLCKATQQCLQQPGVPRGCMLEPRQRTLPSWLHGVHFPAAAHSAQKAFFSEWQHKTLHPHLLLRTSGSSNTTGIPPPGVRLPSFLSTALQGCSVSPLTDLSKAIIRPAKPKVTAFPRQNNKSQYKYGALKMPPTAHDKEKGRTNFSDAAFLQTCLVLAVWIGTERTKHQL